MHLQRSLELVATLLAVLKTGAAYVPLDFESPRERLGTVLRDASPAAIVVHASLVDRLPHTGMAIVIDPQRSFGQPIAAEFGVPTVALAEAVKSEGSIDRVARLYEVSSAVVRDAVRFEEYLLAA